MTVTLIQGDCRAALPTLPAESVQCCVTSPPYYGLRDYGVAGQIGLESTVREFVAQIVDVFREVRRVLRPDGTLWLNLGDSYAANRTYQVSQSKHLSHDFGRSNALVVPTGLKPKDLMMIPARVALALQADGWWLRSDIIWHKPNPMPESVKGSHFARHMVTVADYERLSGLPYIDERAGDDWAGDMPNMSESKEPRGKAPLRAKRKGEGNSACQGRTSGRDGETSGVCPIRTGAKEQKEIRINTEGEGDTAQGREKIRSNREGKAQGSRPPFSDQEHAGTNRSEEGGERTLCHIGEDGGEEAPRLCAAQDGTRSRAAGHVGDVGCDTAAPPESLPLLQATPGSDRRPCDTAEQGRSSRRGKHRPGLPEVQFDEGGQADASLLVGCPGCDKCIRHHGYIFNLSAGRPTSAHEHVFLLSKSERYFYDADAVAEPVAQASIDRLNQPSLGSQVGSTRANGGAKTNGNMKAVGGTEYRNLRNVWRLNPEPFSGWVETVRRVRVASDAPADGKKRITSPDCPLHGDRPARAPKASYGGRGADASTRTACSDARLVPEPAASPAPIGQHHGAAIVGENSGWLLPECSPSATVHSSGTSRTDLAPATTPACTPSAETDSRTHGTSVELELSAHRDCMPESNTGSDGSACSASPQMQSRTARKSGGRGISSASGLHLCTCEYYVEIAEKTSHFATMPPTLAERCIKAGSRPGDIVLDPFGGAGTTGLAADRLGRHATLIELSPDYLTIARRRIYADAPLLTEVA